MRKVDYTLLAHVILRDRAAIKSFEPNEKLREIALEHSESIARQFAKKASVDETEFLKACGIE